VLVVLDPVQFSLRDSAEKRTPFRRLSRRWGSETALEFLERLQATSGTSSPLASEALRQVPQVAVRVSALMVA
jgi:hypothetical protein